MFSKIIKTMNIWIGRVSAGVMGAIVFVVFLQFILRYVFHYGLTYAEELACYLQVWLTFLCACLGFQILNTVSHVKISLFVNKLPSRLQLILYLAIECISLLFMIFLIFKGYSLVKFNWIMRSPAMEFPISIVYLAIPVCSIFMFINILENAIQTLKHYKQGY